MSSPRTSSWRTREGSEFPMHKRNRLPRYLLLALGPAMLAGVLLARVQDNPPGKPAAPAPVKAPLTELSIDLIMKGEDLVGTAPSDPVWATDAKTLYFRWRKPGTGRRELSAVTVANPLPRLVKSEGLLKLPPLRSPRSSRT